MNDEGEFCESNLAAIDHELAEVSAYVRSERPGQVPSRRGWVLEHAQEIIAARKEHPGKTDAWIAAELFAKTPPARTLP